MKIKIPTNCPCCDYTLELVNDQLFCRNQACDAQLSKKLEHFCKALGIKGLGEKTIEKLQLSDITELYYLELDQIIELLGSEKIATKLLL
jgi:DNA ligase (NAD+)